MKVAFNCDLFRLCGDMVECDEEEHKSSCFLRGVRWWTGQVSTGSKCKEAEELGGTELEERGEQETEFKLEVVSKQSQECAAGGGDKSAADVKEMKPKSKERKPEAKQGQDKMCNTAPSIKTLKVKKVVRVTTTNKDACAQVKSDNQKVNLEPSRFLVEGKTGNTCVGSNYKREFKHRGEC